VDSSIYQQQQCKQIMYMKDLREDKIIENKQEAKILSNASKSYNNYFVVPKVLG
jgi:aspartyl/glutamyl-tRNA(Asn/Gln) amidotransferase C subunit